MTDSTPATAPNGDQDQVTATAAGWEPVKTDDAGNVWEWSYRDGQGTRVIVGTVERLYIERLHKRIEELERTVREATSAPPW